MKKYSSFYLVFVTIILSCCTKSNDSISKAGSFISVMVRSDASATPCSGGYIFKHENVLKYQSDSIPGNPPIGLTWVGAQIKFHIINTHCTMADTLIVVDEIIF